MLNLGHSASNDNIRLWNVAEAGEPDSFGKMKSGVQFKIIPGHHGGFISQMCKSLCYLPPMIHFNSVPSGGSCCSFLSERKQQQGVAWRVYQDGVCARSQNYLVIGVVCIVFNLSIMDSVMVQ